jgi:hypothetical protein
MQLQTKFGRSASVDQVEETGFDEADHSASQGHLRIAIAETIRPGNRAARMRARLGLKGFVDDIRRGRVGDHEG